MFVCAPRAAFLAMLLALGGCHLLLPFGSRQPGDDGADASPARFDAPPSSETAPRLDGRKPEARAPDGSACAAGGKRCNGNDLLICTAGRWEPVDCRQACATKGQLAGPCDPAALVCDCQPPKAGGPCTFGTACPPLLTCVGSATGTGLCTAACQSDGDCAGHGLLCQWAILGIKYCALPCSVSCPTGLTCKPGSGGSSACLP